MSSGATNQVYKTGILAIEEALLSADVAIGDTSVTVVINCMTQTPFVIGDSRPYIIQDGSFEIDGVTPTAERIQIVSGTQTAVANSDGIGYIVTCVLTIQGYAETGWIGGLQNAYTMSYGASILTPGVEMAIQSTDFDCRFKTISDAPKIAMDDEASRFATGDEGRDLSIAGARTGEISFTQKLAWAGSVTGVPAWGKIMRAMGHVIKLHPMEGVSFIPSIFANEITATVWIIAPEDGYAPAGTAYRYVGCHGGNACSIAGSKVGDVLMFTGKLSGSYIGTMEIPFTKARVLTSPDTSTPEVMLNTTLTVSSFVNNALTTKQVAISQFSLDFGVVVNPMIDQSTSTGQAYYAGNDRDVKLTCNPVHVRKAIDDVDYIISNEVTGTLKLVTANITIELPNAQMVSADIASREGYVNTNRTYRALRNNLGGGAVDTDLPDGAMYEILIGSKS